jgi:hypothetical protein
MTYETERLKAFARNAVLRACYGAIMDRPGATVSIPALVNFNTAEKAAQLAYDAGHAAGRAGAWLPIAGFKRSGPNESVIVCVTDSAHEPVVGEAWLCADDNLWWWAGTSPDAYHDGPITEINHGDVTHWMPLPAPPASEGMGK